MILKYLTPATVTYVYYATKVYQESILAWYHAWNKIGILATVAGMLRHAAKNTAKRQKRRKIAKSNPKSKGRLITNRQV